MTAVSGGETWEERFRALYPDAFSLAAERLKRRPLVDGEAVVIVLDGRINDRAMTLLMRADGMALVEGYVDGQAQAPAYLHLPLAALVRAQDMYEILLDLGEQRGLGDAEERSEATAVRH